MKRISLFLAAMCAFSVTAGWAQQSQSASKSNQKVVSPLILYDDFNGPLIDPAKWKGPLTSQIMLEAVRELSPSYQGEGNNRRFHIFERAYSPTYDDNGVTYGELGLQFTHPDAVTEVSVNVMVSSFASSGCQSNSSAAGAGAEVRGSFFNTGDGSIASDVMADISLFGDSADNKAPLIADAYVYSGAVGLVNERVLGFVPYGQTARLRLKWDQPNHQFIFQLNNDPEVALGYNLPDTDLPSGPFKSLQVTAGLPNCTTTPPGSEMMDTYYDNVYVNSQ